MSVNETFSTSLSTQSSSGAEVTYVRVIVLRSLFFISAILLNERSPVQFEHMNIRSAMDSLRLETLIGNHARELTLPYQLVLNNL